MIRELVRAGRLLLIPTLALVAVAAFVPGRLTLAIRIYALVACGVLLALAFAALVRAYPASRRLRRRPAAGDRVVRVPTSLSRIEHDVALGVAGAFELHHRLRPRLRDLALELLAVRRRIDLDRDPEAAAGALGAETWEIVRRDRPEPEDRLERGAEPALLGRVVGSLERL